MEKLIAGMTYENTAAGWTRLLEDFDEFTTEGLKSICEWNDRNMDWTDFEELSDDEQRSQIKSIMQDWRDDALSEVEE